MRIKLEYELKKGGEFSSDILIATGDGGDVLFIPLDPNNADYQAYLNRDNPNWGKLTL
jgi:hypothetical protein